MKKPRKSWALLLCLTMFGSMLSACGSTNDDKNAAGNTNANASKTGSEVKKEGFPIVDKPLTLSLMAPDVGVQDWEKMVVLQEMEKLTGIKFNYQNAPQDSFETKKNLVFASGDVPDIFYAADLKPADQVTYGSQGVLIPLEDLIDNYAPNLKKILDDHPDIRKSMTTPDGHIYALRTIDLSAVWYRGPMWYNGKFLQKFGMENKLPASTEELYTYLKRVKSEDANGNGKDDEIPLTSVKLDDLRMFFFGFWNMYDEQIYADKDGKVHFSPQEEGYKGYLTFLNRLWAENLLDHETFSQTDEQKKAKGKNNQVAVFSDYYPYFTLGGEPSGDNPLMTPVKSDIAGSPVYGKHPGLSSNGTFAITKSNPNPEASMRWVDYLYSYEGATLFSQGPENLLWKYTDKEKHVKEWLPVPGGKDREEFKGTMTPNYGILNPGVNDSSFSLGLKSDFDNWIDKENAEKLTPIAKVPFPSVYLSVDEQSEVSALMSDLNTYVKQMEAKFVTGAESLDNWSKYTDQLKKMESDKIVKIYQDAYDRWNSTK
ncbi:ABC transporter substrate-binding protein [Paenibacillus helianthi]|uniref:ABC transporter substrate-binding protein n=1 Tax=Paenibacillus helianthi TaxID=1349432 RepID=A0ABX3ESZ2_9BACL|nr:MULTISPECIES: extracellular solute-binding protein [Paenibacillus]OKP70380.1 ABC transporter substrate-binding protein [Paenibacillus sp. P3E]OKP89870.1 ABC transporter substrate-binding protein [Paenibacillus sp. P32E]OKP91055.1 ABC transporter substrate-binding protein [Paenibacillus helianthi]